MSLNWHESNLLGPIPNRQYGHCKLPFSCKVGFSRQKAAILVRKADVSHFYQNLAPGFFAAFSITVCTVQVSLDGKDRWGHTPLSEAERFGHSHIVGLLKSSHQEAEREVTDQPIEVTDPRSQVTDPTTHEGCCTEQTQHILYILNMSIHSSKSNASLKTDAEYSFLVPIL